MFFDESRKLLRLANTIYFTPSNVSIFEGATFETKRVSAAASNFLSSSEDVFFHNADVCGCVHERERERGVGNGDCAGVSIWSAV